MKFENSVFYKRPEEVSLQDLTADLAEEISMAEYDEIQDRRNELQQAFKHYIEAKQKLENLQKSCDHRFFFDSPHYTYNEAYASRTCAICLKPFNIYTEQVKC